MMMLMICLMRLLVLTLLLRYLRSSLVLNRFTIIWISMYFWNCLLSPRNRVSILYDLFSCSFFTLIFFTLSFWFFRIILTFLWVNVSIVIVFSSWPRNISFINSNLLFIKNYVVWFTIITRILVRFGSGSILLLPPYLLNIFLFEICFFQLLMNQLFLGFPRGSQIIIILIFGRSSRIR